MIHPMSSRHRCSTGRRSRHCYSSFHSQAGSTGRCSTRRRPSSTRHRNNRHRNTRHRNSFRHPGNTGPRSRIHRLRSSCLHSRDRGNIDRCSSFRFRRDSTPPSPRSRHRRSIGRCNNSGRPAHNRRRRSTAHRSTCRRNNSRPLDNRGPHSRRRRSTALRSSFRCRSSKRHHTWVRRSKHH